MKQYDPSRNPRAVQNAKGVGGTVRSIAVNDISYLKCELRGRTFHLGIFLAGLLRAIKGARHSPLQNP